jgi:hypothetical protein
VGSSDGLHWHDYSPLLMDSWLMGIAFHEGRFVGVGLSATILQSREVPEIVAGIHLNADGGGSSKEAGP